MNIPVGFLDFHRDPFINFQLNRWYSLAYTRREDLERVAAKSHNFKDCVEQFLVVAEQAVSENRLQNAAFYYRAAEFLLPPDDPRKLPLYATFSQLFYRAFAEEQIERHEVPYADSALPAMRLAPASGEAKGTLLIFGGFDSFIEEFFCIWKYFSESGYQVIAFEGPGQGAALRTYGLTFDHDWEKPTGAILDHFALEAASLLGISMGGYWSLRAAAFEKRIRSVIAFPPVYDWMEMASPVSRGLVQVLMKRRRLMNFLIRLKMLNSKLNQVMRHTMFLVGTKEPIEAADWFMAMNKEHLHAQQVDQDVLLLGGEHDAFQKPVLLARQKEALSHARSVTTRVFTKAEQGDQHCQIGNLGLALQIMGEWLDKQQS